MQQSPADAPAAPAPPAPAAPPTPTAVIALPGGAIPLEGLPRSVQEVEGLRERREVLRDQLTRATNRREQLVDELNEGIAIEARAGIQQRLSLLDERIMQLERDQALTERQLSSAAPGVLAAAAEEEPSTPQGSVVDEDEAVAWAFGSFGIGVLATLMVGRMRRRFARRRAGVTPVAAASLADDPRFERLTHAVDAMAEEVERIGEGQRFVTQLLAGRRDPAMLGRDAAPR